MKYKTISHKFFSLPNSYLLEIVKLFLHLFHLYKVSPPSPPPPYSCTFLPPPPQPNPPFCGSLYFHGYQFFLDQMKMTLSKCVGFKIPGHNIFFHNSYRKSLIRGYWNSWTGPSMKTTEIGTPGKLSHPQSILEIIKFFLHLLNVPLPSPLPNSFGSYKLDCISFISVTSSLPPSDPIPFGLPSPWSPPKPLFPPPPQFPPPHLEYLLEVVKLFLHLLHLFEIFSHLLPDHNVLLLGDPRGEFRGLSHQLERLGWLLKLLTTLVTQVQ